MIRDQITAEYLLDTLSAELGYYERYGEMAADVNAKAKAFFDAYMGQIPVYAEHERAGSIDVAKEALYLKYTDLLDQPTVNNLKIPIKHSAQIVEVCDAMTSDLRCAIMEIREVINAR